MAGGKCGGLGVSVEDICVEPFDPHPPLRGTLSQRERDSFHVIPSPIGRGCREAAGEGRIRDGSF